MGTQFKPSGKPLMTSGEIYVNPTAGSDATGNGTQGYPFATVGKAISVAQYPCKINISGQSVNESVVLASPSVNLNFEGSNKNESRIQTNFNGTISTYNGFTRLGLSYLSLNSGASPVVTFASGDAGRHTFKGCSFITTGASLFSIPANFTNWLNLWDCDFSGAPAAILALPTVSGATLDIRRAQGVVSISAATATGWTINIDAGSAVNWVGGVPAGCIINRIGAQQYTISGVITTQAALTTLLASASGTGLYVVSGFAPTGLAGLAQGGIIYHVTTGVNLILESLLTAPAVVYVAGVGEYHKTATDWALGLSASDLALKQDALVSGTNIKTVNGQSILGAGDLVIAGGSGGGGLLPYKYLLATADITASILATSLILSWAAIPGATEIKVFVWPDTAAAPDFETATPTKVLAGSATTTTVAGLTIGIKSNYQVYVRGYTVAAGGSVIPLASVAAFEVDSFDGTAGTTAALTWTAFSGASTYRVKYNVGAAISASPTVVAGIASTSVSIAGLVKNSQYCWQVEALNAAGEVIAATGYSQVCSDFIRIVNDGGVRRWTRRDPLLNYEYECAKSGQAYKTPATYAQRKASTKYRYEGDVGDGKYKIEPIRGRGETYTIFCNMAGASAAQSVFYLPNIDTANNQITQEAASASMRLSHMVDDSDSVNMLPNRYMVCNNGNGISANSSSMDCDSMVNTSRVWVSSGNNTTQTFPYSLATLLDLPSGYQSTSQNITWANFLGVRTASGSSRAIAVVIDDISKIIGWFRDGVQYKFTFASLGIALSSSNLLRKTVVTDGVNRLALYSSYLSGAGYLLEFDWDLNTVVVKNSALPALNIPDIGIGNVEEKAWGVQLYTVNGRLFHLSASSSASYAISVRGSVDTPSAVVTTHSLPCSVSVITVGESTIDLVGYISSDSPGGFVGFCDKDHDNIGGVIGDMSVTTAIADGSMWCRTTNIQCLV